MHENKVKLDNTPFGKRPEVPDSPLTDDVFDQHAYIKKVFDAELE